MSLDLAALDPDDQRSPYQQIYGVLRASILTGKLSPGSALWSQNQLAEHFDVSRNTIKEALKLLKNDGLIVARQGGGTYIKARTERPVGLRPHMELAFEQPNVTIDFAGMSGETLHGVIQEPLDKVRHGRITPESIAIRILLSDMSEPVGLPRLVEGQADDPAVRERATRIQMRHIPAITESVGELEALGLVKSASVKVRVHPCAPLFKLYVLNKHEAFFGFYPVIEHAVMIGGKPVPIYDPMGKDAVLFPYAANGDDNSVGSLYVEQAQTWFDSMWNTVAREYSE